jgi:hypothetical protein
VSSQIDEELSKKGARKSRFVPAVFKTATQSTFRTLPGRCKPRFGRETGPDHWVSQSKCSGPAPVGYRFRVNN